MDSSLVCPENAPSLDVFGHNPKPPLTYENVGRHFDSGTAHDYRGGLHRSAHDERAAGSRRGGLKPLVAASLLLLVLPWGIPMLSVDQFLRLISLPAVVAAFLIASQVSGAGTFRTMQAQIVGQQ
jgi:hypothetical protein